MTTEEFRIYKREWYYKNHESEKAKSRLKSQARRERRRALLSQFSCVCCGESDDTVIQWHHREPSERQFSIFGGSGATSGEEKWWDEVLKCIPLCANCHVKIHKEKLCLIPQ